MSVDAMELVVKAAVGVDLNEADTRFHIIDSLLESGLGWPRSAFSLEPSTVDGFADYVLKRPNGSPALIIEAKRTGAHFDLPANYNAGKKFRSVKIKALYSGGLKDALSQAQRYASELGCDFAAVSNGRQFIYFKVFERGRAWKELGAIVISDISWFRENYAEAISMFGYSAVVERASLSAAFRGIGLDAREIYYPKEKVNAYAQTLNQNFLAPSLRPLARKFFGPLAEQEAELINSCYVNQRTYDLSLQGVRTLIKDSVTPFFENYGVVETEDNARGGAVANRIQKNVQLGRGSDVVVLFGGKGSGKSTFLWRALHHQPPQYIKKHVAVATVNMLAVPKDADSIREAIWRGIVQSLDTNRTLQGDRDALTRLFSDRWEVALRQDLHGLDPSGQAFNQTANARLAEWKSDVRYVAQRLAKWHHVMHRGCVVVLDNTDQFENELQDYSFTVAQEVSTELGCLVLISMREERFYASKVRGLLDAYQNNAFHISSPPASQVFIKRLEYLLGELRSGRLDVDEDRRDQLVKFLQVFLTDFKRVPESPLNRFISACAHGNIRLALDLFVDLLLSGYTNAREMVESDRGWTVQIHQVLRPLMSPTRLFYDEKLSKVLNIFQVRVSVGGSHFTGMRVLKLLSEGQDPTSPGFIPFGELKNQFVSLYGGEEDFRVWIDALLSTNLIEASTRQDGYSDDIDAVKITAYGIFALRELSSYFTYIELASTDCGVRDEAVCNELVLLTNEEVALLSQKKKVERVRKRLAKASVFIDYLSREEAREREYFGVTEGNDFMGDIREAFEKEQADVLKSARRNASREHRASDEGGQIG